MAVERTVSVLEAISSEPEGVASCNAKGKAPLVRTTTGTWRTVGWSGLKVSWQFSEPGLTERHEPTPANLTSTKLSCSLVRVSSTLTGEPALDSSVRGRRPWREVSVMELEGGSRTLDRSDSEARRTAPIRAARWRTEKTADKLTSSSWSSDPTAG
jgi:hypothetical protein